MPNTTQITVTTLIAAPVDQVWSLWTEPEHIMQWNSASPDWHTPRATSDVREGGTFTYRMEAKDGSAGFDFNGTFTKVLPPTELAYVMDDGRSVSVTFSEQNGKILVSESFDPESENPLEMQRQGWQSILDTFQKYVESQTS